MLVWVCSECSAAVTLCPFTSVPILMSQDSVPQPVRLSVIFYVRVSQKFLCLFVLPSVSQSVCQIVCFSILLSVSFFISISVSFPSYFCHFVCTCVFTFIFLSVCLYVLSSYFCHFERLYFHNSVSLSEGLYLHISVSLSVRPTFIFMHPRPPGRHIGIDS